MDDKCSSPLKQAVERLRRELEVAGYPKSTRDQYLSVCRAFERYVQREGLDLGQLSDTHVEAFLAEATAGRNLRDNGRLKRQFWRRPVALLFEQLRGDGAIAMDDAPAAPLGAGLAEYLVFLREHRGLSERTVNRQRLQVGRLLTALGVHTEEDLRRISIEQIDRHVIHAARGLGRQSMGAVCASIRGFLGHLHLRGLVRADLRSQVATPHLYALEGMPRAVAWPEIGRTLGAINRTTESGCRDYAMLALIAYCGLRAGDVAKLELGQIDWRHDLIRAPRPKAGTAEDVPLIPAVGEALIAYLRRRRECPTPRIFLTVYAPIRPLADRQICQRARLHLLRAGVKATKLGSHTLRHSFAVELLQRGHSLKAIGDVLGHIHAQSTFIYAKADVEHLREVALGIEELIT